MQELLDSVGDRGEVSKERLAALTAQVVAGLYDEHVGPALDVIQAELERDFAGPGALQATPIARADAIGAVLQTADDGGYLSAGELISSRYEAGDVATSAMHGLTAEQIEQIGEQRLSPAIDRIEDELRTDWPRR